MLQRWHSVKSPSHSKPPNSGTGLSHLLALVWSPPPHSTVHGDHSSHSLNPPSTRIQINKILINFKFRIFNKVRLIIEDQLENRTYLDKGFHYIVDFLLHWSHLSCNHHRRTQELDYHIPEFGLDQPLHKIRDTRPIHSIHPNHHELFFKILSDRIMNFSFYLELQEVFTFTKGFHILGQGFSLHAWVSKSEDPSTVQSSPPNSGAGLSQTRDLPWVPPPQLTGHSGQELHSPQPPFTYL